MAQLRMGLELFGFGLHHFGARPVHPGAYDAWQCRYADRSDANERPVLDGGATDYIVRIARIRRACLHRLCIRASGLLECDYTLPGTNILMLSYATVATNIANGTVVLGTTHAQGLNATTANDVFIGGGGGSDVVSGGAVTDIYSTRTRPRSSAQQ
jgi:hypothetical protein